MALDQRDPAVPLNYAVFLARQGFYDTAMEQIKNFEQRVIKLRMTPNLDADPDVSEYFQMGDDVDVSKRCCVITVAMCK